MEHSLYGNLEGYEYHIMLYNMPLQYIHVTLYAMHILSCMLMSLLLAFIIIVF